MSVETVGRKIDQFIFFVLETINANLKHEKERLKNILIIQKNAIILYLVQYSINNDNNISSLYIDILHQSKYITQLNYILFNTFNMYIFRNIPIHKFRIRWFMILSRYSVKFRIS